MIRSYGEPQKHACWGPGTSWEYMLSPKSECVGWGHRAEMSKPPKASPAGPPPSGCARLRHPPERASEPREGLGTEKGKVAFWLLKGF